MNLVELKNISKIYKTGAVKFIALEQINLTINKGEYLAILGPSGSGKSTLMHILGCLSTPTSGDYLLNGKNVASLSVNQLAKVRNQNIGFVFQNFNLLANLNIVDNVALPLVYRGIAKEERTKKAKELLTHFGLGGHFSHHANELSGGQQQRVAIARSLITEPDIILADEPTGNLDSKSGDDVIHMLEKLNRDGKTIIIVTHDEKIAERTKQIIRIVDGKIM
ncbi:MAG: ABC transporter ATP-binding protein [Gammaproteobacteria bacterium]|nr:ABC transporter ATP-binding protein [Gammaproteobacteria bacterium]